MISESCPCGAGFQSRKYWQVLDWRETHKHQEPAEEIMVPPTGGTSQVELSQADIYFEDRSSHVIGFHP